MNKLQSHFISCPECKKDNPCKEAREILRGETY